MHRVSATVPMETVGMAVICKTAVRSRCCADCHVELIRMVMGLKMGFTVRTAPGAEVGLHLELKMRLVVRSEAGLRVQVVLTMGAEVGIKIGLKAVFKLALNVTSLVMVGHSVGVTVGMMVGLRIVVMVGLMTASKGGLTARVLIGAKVDAEATSLAGLDMAVKMGFWVRVTME